MQGQKTRKCPLTSLCNSSQQQDLASSQDCATQSPEERHLDFISRRNLLKFATTSCFGNYLQQLKSQDDVQARILAKVGQQHLQIHISLEPFQGKGGKLYSGKGLKAYQMSQSTLIVTSCLQPVESIWVVPLQMSTHLHQAGTQQPQLHKTFNQLV